MLDKDVIEKRVVGLKCQCDQGKELWSVSGKITAEWNDQRHEKQIGWERKFGNTCGQIQ